MSTSSLTRRELAGIAQLNASDKTPLILVHGLWLLPESWNRWIELAQSSSFIGFAPDWPDDPETIEEALRTPAVFAGKSVAAVTAHFAEFIARLDRKPVLIGHSFGGLIVQKLAGQGLAKASVAISPGPIKGVWQLPFSSLKAAAPVLGNPANYRRQVRLTAKQFRYAFANTVSEQEAAELYRTFSVPGSGMPLFQVAAATFNPAAETRADTSRADRGPLLVIAAEKDHTVPPALSRAAFRLQRRNPSTTELIELPARAHSLVIDSGWAEVAKIALDFLETSTAATDPR
ncbi:alpha/beta hydrolase [Psychromicrobium sp. YIM B11713]|uniref:alpha/beta hydrolase n=1 Tax=Psychromicrobium sp. YIM B11713 TaxID=3145233 RepID=UPI00374E732E